MTAEDGRFLRRSCEKCGRAIIEGVYVDHADEYWCEGCVENEAEAVYERRQEADLASSPESAREEHIRTWNEKQRLK